MTDTNRDTGHMLEGYSEVACVDGEERDGDLVTETSELWCFFQKLSLEL